MSTLSSENKRGETSVMYRGHHFHLNKLVGMSLPLRVFANSIQNFLQFLNPRQRLLCLQQPIFVRPLGKEFFPRIFKYKFSSQNMKTYFVFILMLSWAISLTFFFGGPEAFSLRVSCSQSWLDLAFLGNY